MPRVLKQETVVLLHTETLVFVPKMVSWDFSFVEGSSSSESSEATCRHSQSPGTPHKLVKTNSKVSSVFPRLLHTSEVQKDI